MASAMSLNHNRHIYRQFARGFGGSKPPEMKYNAALENLIGGAVRESMRTVRGVVALATALLVALSLSGCDRSDLSSKPSNAAAASTKPVEVRLGYFANLSHAQAVLGVASGEFEKAIAPNTLKTHVFNAGPSLIEALFAGEVDIAHRARTGSQRIREEPRRRSARHRGRGDQWSGHRGPREFQHQLPV